MAALTSDTSVTAVDNKDEILDDDFLNGTGPTDDIAVEISPVEGFSEIKMLSSPFGAAMLSPGNEKIDNFYCSSSPDNIATTIGSGTADSGSSIPQWKKDLIQRRKINIARTIGANQSVTCPKKDFLDALESTKQSENDIKLTSPILPLTKPNLLILKSPNNSNNNSTNSNSIDDSNSSEYLDINLHGTRYQNINNDDVDGLNISNCNSISNNQPAKNSIKIQHKQQYNYQHDNDNNDHDNNTDDNNDYIEETGICGGQYTINNMKIFKKSGNTLIKSPQNNEQQQQQILIKSPQYNQQQQNQITSQMNNFSTPIPKQRYSLNQMNSPTGETSLLATSNNITTNINKTTNSSLNIETTSNNLNNCSNDEEKQQLNVLLPLLSPPPSSLLKLASSSLSSTSSNQLHSKHDTIKLSNINIASSSSSSSNELIKAVGLGINNNLKINQKCGINSLPNQNYLKSPIKSNINNNNKYIKNQTQNSLSNQKLKINKKMVAAQDINDSAPATTTTTTGTTNCHNQTPPTIILDDNDSTLSQYNHFDSSEELQYGPGIVSKLRVRYLSLALRQTNSKQRTNLDNLRRATSLNNLLDGGGSTGSTNDGSIIDGDIDNDTNINNIHHHHQQQQQILNHITQHQQQQNINQQNKIHKNVSWLNQNDEKNSNNLIKKFIKEQEEYLNSDNDDHDDDDDLENSKEFDIEKNNGKFLYEKNYKKPENFYNNKTGINNYQQNIQIQKQRNGRQVKRGNDSLKRARSVEALLCEKSSWLNNNKNSTSICGKMSISGGGGEMLLVTEKPESNEINLIGIDNNLNNHKNILNQQKLITIEDKIINARERLHNTNEKLSPPKRLTSFIDDTERPPPDLVKQTLKLFEATANRRNGRNLSRNNNNSSQVAVKIANYKSIISQEKPTISYPKPPLSPKRNNVTVTQTIATTNVNKKPNTLDLKSTKTNNNIGKKSISPICSPVSNLTKKFSGIENNEIIDSNKYKSSAITNQLPSPTTTAAPPQPPQILPRNNLNHVSATDSPITQLTKKLNRLKIQNNNDNNSISSPIQEQQRTPDLIPRKHFENLNNQTDSTTTTDSPITQLTKKLNHLKIQNSPVTTATSLKSPMTIDKNQFTAKTIDELTNNDTSDSITSDDDPDGCNNGIQMVKHISKTALENISKAGTTQHFSFNNNNKINDNSTPGKQIGIIRPLVTELKKDNIGICGSSSGASNIDNNKPQRDNLIISNLSQTKNQFNNINNNNNTSKKKFTDNNTTITSGKNSSDKPALTTREIEKNLINEKKNELANLETNETKGGGNSSSPIWQLNKKIKIGSGSNNGQPIETQNNIMVFNFQDRKDVPDYIENDGLLIKRRRELPKPNESGFVLLGDLTLETSTDPDESWTMGPPSPCNVEFENANIIIDGKSNLRYRSKEVSLRVQFDDTLTSTFEYPSESSLLDDSAAPTVESFSSTIDSLEHIDADEIIQIPNVVTRTPSPTIKPQSTTTGQKSLGNMSLGSAPLGSYTPVKAQIQTNFELGITRVPNNTTLKSNQMNGNNSLNEQLNDDGTSKEIKNSTGNNKPENKNDTASANTNNVDIAAINKISEPESLQYLKPATDDLTVVYSEGTLKTDLLY